MYDLSFRSPKTKIRPSPIHGLGLFAVNSIPAGEIVAVKGGYIFSREQWEHLEPVLADAEIQISDRMFIAPSTIEQRAGSMVCINHSCEPNAAIQGQIVYVAMIDIEPGDEITADWATTDDLDYEMPCRCGASSCRGKVTGKDWQIPELQKKYTGWFCWFLQRKIDALTDK